MMYLMMIVVALLAIGFAVWPLLREAKPEEEQDLSSGEGQYQLRLRQLEEIALDRAAGRLGGEEYEALRKEIQAYLDEMKKGKRALGEETKSSAQPSPLRSEKR